MRLALPMTGARSSVDAEPLLIAAFCLLWSSAFAVSKLASTLRHSGAPRSGEPGIHNRRPIAVDSGLATFGGAPE